MFRKNSYEVKCVFLNCYIWKSTYLTSLCVIMKVKRYKNKIQEMTVSLLQNYKHITKRSARPGLAAALYKLDEILWAPVRKSEHMVFVADEVKFY